MKEDTPLLVPVLAALPVFACMAVLGLPSIGHGHAAAFRTLFFVACAFWTIPLVLLQRRRKANATPEGAGLAPPELSESERARVDRLLAEGPDGSRGAS